MERQRKFLVVLPLIAVPFLSIAFYAMGGGRGAAVEHKLAVGTGFNMELPPAVIDPKEDKMDKLAYYERAEADSARRKQLLQLDPYRRKDKISGGVLPGRPTTGTQADTMLHRLDVLKKQLDRAEVRSVAAKRQIHREAIRQDGLLKEAMLPPARHVKDTVATDPELDRLNEMLDKIARLEGIGHGEREQPEKEAVPAREGITKKETATDRDVSVGIPATVESDQELMNGAVLPMRLTSAILYNGITLPRGQQVYGMVTMSGDRMQVNIHSIRCGSAIITTAWQVYDMDGLQGIRIPDGLGRQVARQSADQGIGSLNLAAYDPSVGAQVTSAGIQAARSFFSRKVRTVRVMVPAGYQVLLRDTRTGGGAVRVLADTVVERRGNPAEAAARKIMPPVADSLEPYLHVSAREGKVKVILKGIYQRDGLIWLYLALKNKGSLVFVPEQVHCTIRQEKHWKRMAIQEISLLPVYDSLPSEVVPGGEAALMVGLKPFVLAKDKRLAVEVGERGGARVLELKVAPRLILNTR